MYQVFEHTADLGLQITAPDLDTLFVEAARGLFSLIVENFSTVKPLQAVEIKLQETDLNYLLVDWLRELLFTFDSQHLLFCEFEVKVEENGLQAVARGETLDTDRHITDHEVKAITYHELKVEQTAQGWLAEVIIDI